MFTVVVKVSLVVKVSSPAEAEPETRILVKHVSREHILDAVDEWNQRDRKVYQYYTEALSDALPGHIDCIMKLVVSDEHKGWALEDIAGE